MKNSKINEFTKEKVEEPIVLKAGFSKGNPISQMVFCSSIETNKENVVYTSKKLNAGEWAVNSSVKEKKVMMQFDNDEPMQISTVNGGFFQIQIKEGSVVFQKDGKSFKIYIE